MMIYSLARCTHNSLQFHDLREFNGRVIVRLLVHFLSHSVRNPDPRNRMRGTDLSVKTPPLAPEHPPSRPSGNKPLGDWGERLAAEFLAERGWVILHRNYRIGHREVDLVARCGGVVAFVEVKTRGGTGYGHPLEAIIRKKRREIQQVAAAWIEAHGLPSDVYRFDAVAILLPAGGAPVIEHVEDAWRIW